MQNTKKTASEHIAVKEIAEQMAKLPASCHHEAKQNINIYKQADISKLFSNTVDAMLENGYEINAFSMNIDDCYEFNEASIADIVFMDTEQEYIYRVLLSQEYDIKHNKLIKLSIRVYPVSYLHNDTIYNAALKKYPIAIWYNIDRMDAHTSMEQLDEHDIQQLNRTFTDADGFKKMQALHDMRISSQKAVDYDILNDKNRDAIAEIVKHHRGYARVNIKNISGVYRYDYRHANSKTLNAYEESSEDSYKNGYRIEISKNPSQADPHLCITFMK